MRKTRYLVVYDQLQYEEMDYVPNEFQWCYGKKELKSLLKSMKFLFKEYGVQTYVKRIVEFK
jgi:hypothetical protein